MFRLEKVMQNDDSAYIYFAIFFKTLVIFISYYFFSILEKNTIYDLGNVEIYSSSNLYEFSIFLSFLYISISFLKQNKKKYYFNFISFLRDDLLTILISTILIFAFFFTKNKIFLLDKGFSISFIVLIVNLFIAKLILNSIYEYMINNNIIHKNIMLVGDYSDIKKFLKYKKEKINVFKCCIIQNLEGLSEKLIRNEIKIPLFKTTEDIRSILEYHELGQIWILESEKSNTEKLISNIIKFSVDILIVNLNTKKLIETEDLLYGKFEFKKYEVSRFYGINFLIKIILDKIFSLTFIIIASPILLISTIFIYIEDGFPILFTQNRTGWDGRRFKIFKLRTLKKGSFDKTVQVTKEDKRKLKCGTIIRQLSIDELPQLLNVLKGDMSIVGPRPHMVEHDIKYSKLFSSFLKRHKCSPGLTGWAQVNGLRGATPNPENMKKRMEHDLWYLNNWTIYLDIYIILKTFYVIFKYKGD